MRDVRLRILHRRGSGSCVAGSLVGADARAARGKIGALGSFIGGVSSFPQGGGTPFFVLSRATPALGLLGPGVVQPCGLGPPGGPRFLCRAVPYRMLYLDRAWVGSCPLLGGCVVGYAVAVILVWLCVGLKVVAADSCESDSCGTEEFKHSFNIGFIVLDDEPFSLRTLGEGFPYGSVNPFSQFSKYPRRYSAVTNLSLTGVLSIMSFHAPQA